jgi:hypothetical protein
VHHGPKSGSSSVGPVFLHEGGHNRQNHHAKYDSGGPGIAQNIRHECQGEQQCVERIPRARPKFTEDRRSLLARYDVGTEFCRWRTSTSSWGSPSGLAPAAAQASPGDSRLMATNRRSLSVWSAFPACVRAAGRVRTFMTCLGSLTAISRYSRSHSSLPYGLEH